MENNIRINIDYIRHAFSYANAEYIKEYKHKNENTSKDFIEINNFKENRMKKYPDALITDFGKQQAINLGIKFKERFEKADIICCSELRRTMETAMLSCKNIHKKLYVIPYISEIDTNYDNCPLEFNKNYMKKYQQNYIQYIIKNRLLSYIYINKNYPSINGYPTIDNSILLENDVNIPKPTTSNHNKFYSVILPKICNIIFKNSNKKEFNIMIFTHSGFIKNHFGFNGKTIGKLNIFTDNRFNNINNYISIHKTPYNTNIYTEHIYMKNNKLYHKIADPCNCNIICSYFHQLQLNKQNN